MQLPAVTLEHVIELVRKELRARKGKWRELAAGSGGRVTWRWILTFAAHHPNPTIENVVAIARAMKMTLPPVLLTGVPSSGNGLPAAAGKAPRGARGRRATPARPVSATGRSTTRA